MAVGARGIYRKWHDIIDDIKVLTEEGLRIATPRNFSNDIINREYMAFELTFNKRFSERFQAVASYTLSEVTGNADRSWGQVAFTSQLLDYPNDICEVPAHRQRGERHPSGGLGAVPRHPRPQPRRSAALGCHQLRQGLHGVHVSARQRESHRRASITWFSGLPFQQQRLLQINGDTDTYYDTPQGSARLKDWYQLNFSLEAAFPLVDPVEIALKADIFNLTNQQSVIDPTRVVLTPTDDFGTPTSRLSFNAPRGYQFGAVVRF